MLANGGEQLIAQKQRATEGQPQVIEAGYDFAENTGMPLISTSASGGVGEGLCSSVSCAVSKIISARLATRSLSSS
jgi:hypothetical protein